MGIFECVMKEGELLFKDEHGVAEILMRAEKKFYDRIGKRPGKRMCTVLQMRCSTCSKYEEFTIVGMRE